MTSIMFFLIFIPVLGLILLNLNFFLAPHRPYKEKKTPFECGYHSFTTQNRSPFTISFFLFGLAFLIFDLEITTAFPYVASSDFNGSYGFFVVISFILVLTLGFVFELGKDALKIDTKQDKSSLQGSIFNARFLIFTDFFNQLKIQSYSLLQYIITHNYVFYMLQALTILFYSSYLLYALGDFNYVLTLILISSTFYLTYLCINYVKIKKNKKLFFFIFVVIYIIYSVSFIYFFCICFDSIPFILELMSVNSTGNSDVNLCNGNSSADTSGPGDLGNQGPNGGPNEDPNGGPNEGPNGGPNGELSTHDTDQDDDECPCGHDTPGTCFDCSHQSSTAVEGQTSTEGSACCSCGEASPNLNCNDCDCMLHDNCLAELTQQRRDAGLEVDIRPESEDSEDNED